MRCADFVDDSRVLHVGNFLRARAWISVRGLLTLVVISGSALC